MEYPKIETLYNRDPETFIVTDELRCPEFLIPRAWLVTEKIDGVNIRVQFLAGEPPRFFGRTDNADMHPTLRALLTETFTGGKLAAAFLDPDEVWLFGEGYGPKIQSGGNYAPSVRMRLFDVKVGQWWLNWASIEDVARKLGIETVPLINRCAHLEQIEPIVTNLMSDVSSAEAQKYDHPAEGVVCRTEPLLMMRNGERLMFKLKRKDFARGKR